MRMKSRIAVAGLTLALLLPCQALAFSDVPEGAWYADSVELCAGKGLLQGTGEGAFSPEGSVTLAEVMTAAARIHYQSEGGQGELPQAPESWGTGAISTPGGAELLRFNTCGLDRELTYRFDTESPRQLHLYLAVTPEERKALTPAGGAASAILTLNGKEVLAGGLAPAAEDSGQVEFIAGPDSDYTAFNRELAAFLPAPATGKWYRNALWYAREHGLLDSQPEETAFEDPATRLDLAEWLCSALPETELVPIKKGAETLPDTADPAVLALYQAGILTGVDQEGTFAGQRGLTRAELAVVLARVADPARRIGLPAAGAS